MKKVFSKWQIVFSMVDDMDIGYAGKSNKQLIKTGQDVDDTYTSRFDHKYEELVIYIKEKKGKRQGQKRKLSTDRNGRWTIFVYFNCYLVFASVYANFLL